MKDLSETKTGNIIHGLAHIGIPTEQLEASRKFYETIGFSSLEEDERPGGKRVLFMEKSGLVLEIYEDPAAFSAGAVDHFALETEDPEACLNFAGEQGYTVLKDGVQILELPGRTVKYFNILGPNGEKIEFCRNEKK